MSIFPPRLAPVDGDCVEYAKQIIEQHPELVHRNRRALVAKRLEQITGIDSREAFDTVDYLFASIAAGTVKPDYRLHQPEFRVERRDGSDMAGRELEGARYFVLDFVHDPVARYALRSYAAACEDEDLAAAIIRELSILHNQEQVEKEAGDGRG